MGRTTRRHPATSSRISSFHSICSHHVHVIGCPPPNVVYPCFSSSSRKASSFYFTFNCSQVHAITSSFPVAESFRCLICSKMPFPSGILIFFRIHVLVFRFVQLILSIRRHTYIPKVVTSFSSHFFSAHAAF